MAKEEVRVYVITSTHTYDHEASQSVQACTTVAGVSRSVEGVERLVAELYKGCKLSWNGDKKSARAYHEGSDIEVELRTVHD